MVERTKWPRARVRGGTKDSESQNSERRLTFSISGTLGFVPLDIIQVSHLKNSQRSEMDRDVQNPGTDESAAVLSDSEGVARDILIDDAVREGKSHTFMKFVRWPNPTQSSLAEELGRLLHASHQRRLGTRTKGRTSISHPSSSSPQSFLSPWVNRSITASEPTKPCLIHGDCCEGNVGTVSETVKIVLFDAGAYYAHDEMEMGIWRAQSWQAFAQEKHVEAYWRLFAPTEPVRSGKIGVGCIG